MAWIGDDTAVFILQLRNRAVGSNQVSWNHFLQHTRYCCINRHQEKQSGDCRHGNAIKTRLPFAQ